MLDPLSGWLAVAATEQSRSVHIRAPVDQVWAKLADFEGIVEWAPNVDHSVLTSEQTTRIGAERRVQAGRVVLLEKITVWDPPHKLRYRIDGLPVKVAWLDNEWSVVAEADGSSVTLRTEVDGGSGIAKRLLGRVIAKKLATSSVVMLSGLAAAVESERPTS